MPFTFSHPFIILPLCRKKYKYFSMTALVTGSMSLDFEYFIYMKKLDHDSFHTATGIFIFGLPAGLLLAFIYHLFVRDAFIDSLPDNWWRRFKQYKKFNWVAYCKQHYLVVLSSLLIGILSHLFLDAFTHRNGLFVNWLPFLRMEIFWHGEKMPVYDVLQVVLSIVGAFVIYVALIRMPQDKDLPGKNTFDLRYWLLWLICFSAIMLVRFTMDQRHNDPVDILMAAIASALMGALLASVLVGKLRPAME